MGKSCVSIQKSISEINLSYDLICFNKNPVKYIFNVLSSSESSPKVATV